MVEDEVLFKAIIHGNHNYHEDFIPKPIHEHLVHVITKAAASHSYLKEAVATETGIQISPRTITRIRMINDGSWENMWKKIPSFIAKINSNGQNLGHIKFHEEFSDVNMAVFVAFPFTGKSFAIRSIFGHYIY